MASNPFIIGALGVGAIYLFSQTKSSSKQTSSKLSKENQESINERGYYIKSDCSGIVIKDKNKANKFAYTEGFNALSDNPFDFSYADKILFDNCNTKILKKEITVDKYKDAAQILFILDIWKYYALGLLESGKFFSSIKDINNQLLQLKLGIEKENKISLGNQIPRLPIGYYFIDCKLVVENPDRAYLFAYRLGKIIDKPQFTPTSILQKIIFDECDIFSSNNPKFMFDLFRYNIAGFVESNQLTKDDGLKQINLLKQELQNKNINVSKFEFSIPQIIEV